MAKPSVDLSFIEIQPLTSGDDVRAFCCGDLDLDDFIKTDALTKQHLDVVRVYLARYHGELAGYVALLTDCVKLQQGERKKLKLKSGDHPSVPALKVGRIATSTSFKERHRGLGTTLMAFSLAVATRLAREAGCRLLTVDAYPASVDFYRRLGFVVNKAGRKAGRQPVPAWRRFACWVLRRYDDGERISMRFDIKSDPPPPWAL